MTISRFLTKVDKHGPVHPVLRTHCWVWTGSVRGEGYAQFWYKGLNRKASRVSYQLFVGDIPMGRMVLHKCDNRMCVNPDHLYLGDHTDNMRDRNSRGRQASGIRNGAYTKPERVPRGARSGAALHPESHRGERNGRSVLTEDAVREIRFRYANGESRADLARCYSVTWRVINLVVTRRSWICVM
jgi:HNH endonuclease